MFSLQNLARKELVKPRELGHGWLIIYHIKQGVWLLIYALISIKQCLEFMAPFPIFRIFVACISAFGQAVIRTFNGLFIDKEKKLLIYVIPKVVGYFCPNRSG